MFGFQYLRSMIAAQALQDWIREAGARPRSRTAHARRIDIRRLPNRLARGVLAPVKVVSALRGAEREADDRMAA